jgi:hypothetical protein
MVEELQLLWDNGILVDGTKWRVALINGIWDGKGYEQACIFIIFDNKYSLILNICIYINRLRKQWVLVHLRDAMSVIFLELVLVIQ